LSAATREQNRSFYEKTYLNKILFSDIAHDPPLPAERPRGFLAWAILRTIDPLHRRREVVLVGEEDVGWYVFLPRLRSISGNQVLWIMHHDPMALLERVQHVLQAASVIFAG